MAQNSPQAINIPQFRGPVEYLAHPPAVKFDMDNQGIINGDTNGQIANSGKGPYLIPQDETRQIGKRLIQNIGTDPILVHVGGQGVLDLVNAGNFEAVLAGGSADNDGLGSQIDLSNVNGRVSIMVETGTLRASIFQAYTPDLMGRTGQAPVVIPSAA